MKNVFKFIITAVITGLAFAIPMELIGIFFGRYFNIYAFLYLLIFGPLLVSCNFILLLVIKKIKPNPKIIKAEYYTSKPVIITAIIMFVFSSLFFIYYTGNAISQDLISHYIHTKQYDKVITTTKRLEKLYPKELINYSAISYAYEMKHNYAESIHYRKEDLKYEPDYYPSYIDIADSLYLMNEDDLSNDYKSVIAELDKALKINKDSFVALYHKQYIFFKVNDCQNGIKEIENILDIIDKKGDEKYTYKKGHLRINESLPENWRDDVIKNLSSCPNTKEKETVIKKIKNKKI